MVQLCHSNDLGSLMLCNPFACQVLALLFALQLVNTLSPSSCNDPFSHSTTTQRIESSSVRAHNMLTRAHTHTHTKLRSQTVSLGAQHVRVQSMKHE
jgi:hypothetical protein